MHAMAEHKKKAEVATAAMVVPATSEQDPLSIAGSDSEDNDEDSDDSAYNAFVAFTTDLEVGDDVPPERPMPQVREVTLPGIAKSPVYLDQVTPASTLQGHIWSFQHWIDGKLYYASSNAPSATFYRAAAMPIPNYSGSTSASTAGNRRRRRRPRKNVGKVVCGQVKDVCGQGK